MASADLPRSCSHLDLIESLNYAGAFAEDWEPFTFRIPEDCFISSSAITFLGAWGLKQRNTHRCSFVLNHERAALQTSETASKKKTRRTKVTVEPTDAQPELFS